MNEYYLTFHHQPQKDFSVGTVPYILYAAAEVLYLTKYSAKIISESSDTKDLPLILVSSHQIVKVKKH